MQADTLIPPKALGFDAVDAQGEGDKNQQVGQHSSHNDHRGRSILFLSQKRQPNAKVQFYQYYLRYPEDLLQA